MNTRRRVRGFYREIALAGVAVMAAAVMILPAALQPAFALATTTDAITAINQAAPEVLAEPGGGRPLPENAQEGFTLAEGITLTPEGLSSNAIGVDLGHGIRSYGTTSTDTEFVAQAAASGTRMMHLLSSPDAPTEHAYNMTVPSGTSVAVGADGGVVITGKAGNASYLRPAWAKDANGKSVATRYEIRGTQLIQVVDHKGAAYPVVADPAVVLVIPAYYIWKIVRCGFGGYLGWIAAAGYNWYWRALAVVGSCLVAV
jgi:hypothetical protein